MTGAYQISEGCAIRYTLDVSLWTDLKKWVRKQMKSKKEQVRSPSAKYGGGRSTATRRPEHYLCQKPSICAKRVRTTMCRILSISVLDKCRLLQLLAQVAHCRLGDGNNSKVFVAGKTIKKRCRRSENVDGHDSVLRHNGETEVRTS